MDVGAMSRRFCLTEIWRLLAIICLAAIGIIIVQCSAISYGKEWSVSPTNKGLEISLIKNDTFSKTLQSSRIKEVSIIGIDSYSSDLGVEVQDESDAANATFSLVSDKKENDVFVLETGATLGKSLTRTGKADYSTQTKGVDIGHGPLEQVEEAENVKLVPSPLVGEVPRNYVAFLPTNLPLEDNVTQIFGTNSKNANLLAAPSLTFSKNLSRASMSSLKRSRVRPTSISQMNLLLLHHLVSSHSMRPQRSSVRDHELLSAKLQIENAPVIKSTRELNAIAFRNVSRFKRSYELMERVLKVYIYKEGDKPIFHQPKMRGIYASEGWFMKLIEGNKKFVVKDPRKAHLFYLPFSSNLLRTALFGENFQSWKDLEGYLKNYVVFIAKQYRFWNRTAGADHFFVGCHDWALRLTRHHMSNCIRVLCNANVASGFKIGQDTTLPVTYIRSSETPSENLGGKSPWERHILAFFAGSMHGYLRPILLQYWENKQSDMKIFGPMSLDIAGKRMYRDYMKSSKYCICARGYEVHTPRVVEAIFYECVPVIISDNYVPPFFEVLNWESFAVFVPEKDIPNLRNILLAIPEEKYLAMQLRVKMVQKHFLWHKKPVKYDLFHMILHSVWYTRVFRMKG